MLRFTPAGSYSWKIFAGAVFLLLPLLSSPVEAQACWTPLPNSTINITNSTTLCTGTYNLNVTLAASNIELNCNNSLLFGNGSSWRYVVGASNQLNVTIRNCVVRTATNGIRFDNVSKGTILNNSIPKFGFVSTNSEGISTWDTNELLVENNSVTNVGGAAGIQFETLIAVGCRNSVIRGNNVSYNSFGYGIFFDNGENCTIQNNLLINNGGGAGINLEGISPGPGVKNSTVINNTAISATSGAGIWLNHGNYNNIIRGNNFSGNRYGIRIIGSPEGVSNNTLVGNNLSDNTNGGVFIADTAITNNLFLANFFSNNSPHASSPSTPNSLNTTFGNSWDGLNTSNFTDSDLDAFYDSGPGWPYNQANGGNVSANVADYRPCKYKNCLGLAARSPAWNAAVSSQAVFFSVRSNSPVTLAALAVQVNGATSAAFGPAACSTAWKDTLGFLANCTYTETSIVSGPNSIAVNATDGDGVNGNFSLNFTYSPPPPPPPVRQSSGGGGGSSPATAPEPAAAVETRSILSISPFTPVTIAFPLTALSELSIETKTLAAAVSVTVTQHLSRPAGVAEPPAVAAVNKYISVDAKNIAPGDYKRVTLKFSVERAWLDRNNLSDDRVALARYGEAQKEWRTFPAKKTNEAGGAATFEATVPGLSLFAIVAGPAPPPAPSPGPSVAPLELPASPSPTGAGAGPSPPGSPPPGRAPPVPTPRSPGFEAVLGVTALLLTTVALAWKKR